MVNVKVVAFGFAALLVALGVILLLAGYNISPTNQSEISSGWTLIVIGVIIWLLSFSERILRKALR